MRRPTIAARLAFIIALAPIILRGQAAPASAGVNPRLSQIIDSLSNRATIVISTGHQYLEGQFTGRERDSIGIGYKETHSVLDLRSIDTLWVRSHNPFPLIGRFALGGAAAGLGLGLMTGGAVALACPPCALFAVPLAVAATVTVAAIGGVVGCLDGVLHPHWERRYAASQ